MVKVQKVVAWKIGNVYIENAKEAEIAVRAIVIREMMTEAKRPEKGKDEADWFAENWETIEQRVKTAMVGT